MVVGGGGSGVCGLGVGGEAFYHCVSVAVVKAASDGSIA